MFNYRYNSYVINSKRKKYWAIIRGFNNSIIFLGNIVLKDDTIITVIFSTRLLKENIKYDKNEILDVKWFTYEELLNMKDELREYNLIINSISTLIENKVADIDLVKIIYL